MAPWGLLSCSGDDPYDSEYYDSSYSFIDTIGLDSFVGDDSTSDSAQGISGSWDFAWRGNSGTSGFTGPGGEYPYMSLTDAALSASDSSLGTAPDGLEASSEVYRLSLANLFVDGDFSAYTVGASAGWSGGTNTTAAVIADGATGSIHGNTLNLYIKQKSEPAVLTISSYADDGAPSSAFYSMGFNYFSTGTIAADDLYFSYGSIPSSGGESLVATSSSSTSSGSVILSTPDLSTYDTLNIAANDTTLYLDDLTLVREDLEPALRLYLTPTDTASALVPGRYEFSVWVHTDPDASDGDAAAGDSTVDDPYLARYLTLNMVSWPEGNVSGVAYGSASFSDSDWASGWTRLSVTFNDNKALYFDETDDASSIVLGLEVVMHSSSAPGRYPGSILIASPALYLALDG